MTELHLWLRHETRTTERRTPVVPSDAARLVDAGVTLTVEDSPQRVHPIEAYERAGCRVAEAGSWVSAPPETVVVGLKELPDEPAGLTHRHIFFGHAYKRQPGAEPLLRRFLSGGGALLDLEYLVDDEGRRLAAFGYWAGYLGAALAVLHHRGALKAPLHPHVEGGAGRGTRRQRRGVVGAGDRCPRPQRPGCPCGAGSGRGGADLLGSRRDP